MWLSRGRKQEKRGKPASQLRKARQFLAPKSMFFPFKLPRTCFHKSIFLLLLLHTLAFFVLYANLLGPSLLTRFIAKSSGTIKSSHHIANWHYKGPSLGHLPHLLPTSRKSTCDELSITATYLPIHTPECNIRLPFSLPSFFAMQFPFLPFLYSICSPSPIYPLCNVFLLRIYIHTSTKAP
jgi:hypothetical protein